MPDAQNDELLSSAAARATTSAFARLTQAQAAKASESGDKALERFLGEMLRPMLKEWLDKNLPPIVERVVEEEVRKLSGRTEQS